MGARAKRRLISVAVAAVAVVVAAGSVVYFLDSNSSTGSRTSEGSTPQSQTQDQSLGVSYGDHVTQVQAKVGSPTRKQGACWIYNAKAHTLSGEYLGAFVDGVRYCFGDGPAGGTAVTAIEVHLIPHTLLNGKWYPGGWNQAVAVSPPSS